MPTQAMLLSLIPDKTLYNTIIKRFCDVTKNSHWQIRILLFSANPTPTQVVIFLLDTNLGRIPNIDFIDRGRIRSRENLSIGNLTVGTYMTIDDIS